MTRILVAEDSPVNMALLADLLELSGHEVLQARNGREAVEVARAQRPDVILMDMMMPVMDGFQATQQLKADDATRGIPVVALTALAMDGDDRRALDAGCDAYVTKPIDTRALPQLLDKLLHRAPAVPQHVLRVLDGELQEGLEAIVAAAQALERRGNDHAAARQVHDWAHRLKGGAASVGFEDLARELGHVEEAARRADQEGRYAPEALADLRARVRTLYAMRARVAEEARRGA